MTLPERIERLLELDGKRTPKHRCIDLTKAEGTTSVSLPSTPVVGDSVTIKSGDHPVSVHVPSGIIVDYEAVFQEAVAIIRELLKQAEGA